MVCNIRVHFYRSQTDHRQGLEGHFARDPIPVRLGMVGNTVGVFTYIHDHPVIHADGQKV